MGDADGSCFPAALLSSPPMTSTEPRHHDPEEPSSSSFRSSLHCAPDVPLADTLSDYGSDIVLDDDLLLLLDTPAPGDAEAVNPAASLQAAWVWDNARIDALEHAAVVHAAGALPANGAPLQNLPPDESEPGADHEATRDAEEDVVEASPPGVEDTRSPFDRFRDRKKALTVTDLVSNLWCEQQLEYTLIRGFKRRTPAMRRGTSVHRILEEEVHTVVPVDVKTKEDRWGLKLFNMCQGLSFLQQEGLTRELPVFGFIDGVLVRGIIDELVYRDPAGQTDGSNTINEEGSYRTIRRNSKAYRNPEPDTYDVPPAGKRKVYISDAKSRAHRSLPTASQAKATALQLMTYHRLLEQMLSGKTDISRLLEHYSLDGHAQLSDSLIADICQISVDVSVEVILAHNSLFGMWDLMRRQMATSIDSLGTNMGISYRDQADGKIFAYQTIPYDGDRLGTHLGSTLSWWRGERATIGVDIEEAWKCSSCEFADECSWRLGKLAELKKTKRKASPTHVWAKKA